MADRTFDMEATSGDSGLSFSPQDLAAFRAGDTAVFRELVERHTPRLLGFVRPFARDIEDTHDLVQEIWLRVYRKREAYAGTGSVFGWILAVGRNVCLGTIRKRRDASQQSDPDGVPHSGTADRRAEQNALRRDLNEAILELPDRERDVLMLRLVEERSTRDTAMAMRCAEGTVKATLYHATKKLRVAMEAWKDEVVSGR